MLTFRSTDDSDEVFITTLSDAAPPAPLQVRVYVFELDKFEVDILPEKIPFSPDQSPEAVQEVVFVDVQVKTAELLLEIVIGPSELLALIFTVGAGGTQVTVSVAG